jgi:tetratricopeptide (TPR) repeat protein
MILGLLVTEAAQKPDRAPATKGKAVQPASGVDPVEAEYEKLLELDDAAQTEVDQWIRDNHGFRSQGGGLSDEALAEKVERRLETVKTEYDLFLRRHPKHVRALLAYGSFLNDTRDEIGAVEQWDKARRLDPKNPAAWNNLANYYGHRGPVKKAFDYYAKAIELNSKEPVYYQNLGTTVFLFRKDAREHYDLSEQQVFDKALELYRQARKLAPNDFLLAQDVAQTYYGIKPPRYEEAIAAWQDTLQLAADDIQREGVLIHLARVKVQCGRLAEAKAHLEAVTHAAYADLRARVERTLKTKLEAAGAAPATDASAGTPAVEKLP